MLDELGAKQDRSQIMQKPDQDDLAIGINDFGFADFFIFLIFDIILRELFQLRFHFEPVFRQFIIYMRELRDFMCNRSF